MAVVNGVNGNGVKGASFFGKEPVVLTNAVTEIIRNFILVLIGFGIVVWSTEQVALVLAVVGSTMALINIIVGRGNSTPTAAPNLPVGTSVNSGTGVVVPQSTEANALLPRRPIAEVDGGPA